MFISVVALCIQLFLQRTGSQNRIPPRLAQRIHPILKRLHARRQEEERVEAGESSDAKVATTADNAEKEGDVEQLYTAHIYSVLLLGVISFLLFVIIFVFS